MNNENTISDYRISNIYYMLAYAFNSDKLHELKKRNVSTEKFENIYDIYAVLLSSLSDKLVKKGLIRQYVNQKDETNIVKGKINFSDTIKSNSMSYKKVVCEYDEYTQNNYLNSIIKTTIYHLLNSNVISNKSIKTILKKTYFYFSEIDMLDYLSIKWDNVNYNKNNENYRIIIELCRLINRGSLVTEKDGKRKFFDFQDDQALHSLFEKFVREYLRKKFPQLNPRIEKIKSPFEGLSIVPAMYTDISIEFENKIMIIDTKFYKHILNKVGYHGYGSLSVNQGNVFQLTNYMMAKQTENMEKNVSGMLLYAKTDENFYGESGSLNILQTKKRIHIKTLDIRKEFGNINDNTEETICGQLNKIATDFMVS